MAEINQQDIISDDALKAPLILRDNLEEAYLSIKKFIAAGKEAGVFMQAAASTRELRDETVKLTASQLELAKVEKQIATLIAKDNDEYRAQKKVVEDLNATIKAKAVLGERDAKSINASNSSLKEISAALNKARFDYGNLRGEQERGSVSGKELLGTIKQLDTEFKKLSADIGQNQPNVGNYADAAKDLKAELKALRSEMLGTATAFGTNSKEFQDVSVRAEEAKEKLEFLDREFKQVADTSFEKLGNEFGVFVGKLKGLDFKGASVSAKRFAEISNTISFKEASAGITDFGKSLSTVGKAILTNPLFLLAAVILGITVAIVKFSQYIDPLVKLFNVVGDAIGTAIQYLKDLADQLGLTSFAQVKAVDKMIAANDKLRASNEEEYRRYIALLKARGENTLDAELKIALIRKKFADDNIKIAADELNRLAKMRGEHDGKRVEELQKRLQDEVKASQDAQNEIAVLEAQEATRIVALYEKQQHAFSKAQQIKIENAALANETIASQEGRSLTERLSAVGKAEDLRIALIQNKLNDELRFFKGLQAERAVIVAEANKEIAAVEEKASKERVTILIQSAEEQKKLSQQIAADEHNTFETRIAAVMDYSETSQRVLDLSFKNKLITEEAYNAATVKLTEDTTDQLVKLTLDRAKKLEQLAINKGTTNKDAQLIALNESLAAQEISHKQYVQQVKDIQKGFNLQVEQEQLRSLQTQLDALNQYGGDASEVQKQIAEIELAISNDRIAKRIEGEELLGQRLHDLQTAAVDSFFKIVDDQNAAADERRSIEAQKIQDQLAIDLQLAGDNEQAKLDIKAKANVELQKIRQQQAEADRKRAIFEKAVAAVSVVINTAKGIGQALGTYPPPVSFVLAAVTAALGAVQLAAILAKPIPQYAIGTENHRGGYAIIGEQGPELVKEPGKRPYLSPGRPSLVDLPAGSSVKTAGETARLLAIQGLPIAETRGTREDLGSQAVVSELSDMHHTLKTKRSDSGLHPLVLREMVRREANIQKSLKDFYA